MITKLVLSCLILVGIGFDFPVVIAAQNKTAQQQTNNDDDGSVGEELTGAHDADAERIFSGFIDKDWEKKRHDIGLDVGTDEIFKLEEDRLRNVQVLNVDSFFVPTTSLEKLSEQSSTDSISSNSNENDLSDCETIDDRLHLAVNKVNKDSCASLLRHGVEVNGLDKEGKTALHVALLNGIHTNGVLELCEFLIASGASLELLTAGKGWAPIHCASVHDDPTLVMFLLEKGAAIDSQTGLTEDTPLHIAVKQGNARLCQYLIQRGANKEIKNKDLKKPFDCAFERTDISVSKIFTAKLNELIQGSIRANRPRVLQSFLAHSKNPKSDLSFEDGTTALHLACTAASKDHNLDQGLAVGSEKVKQVPLENAAGVLQSQLIRDLIRIQNVDSEDALKRTPLHIAIEWGQEAACMTLLELHASLTKPLVRRNDPSISLSPLKLSVLYDNKAIMILLLMGLVKTKGGKEIEKEYPELLKVAIDNNSEHIVELLVSLKSSRRGNTTQELENDYPDLLKKSENSALILLSLKNALHDTNAGESIYPLHRACMQGNKRICELLLNETPDANVLLNVDRQKDPLWNQLEDTMVSPLHCAVIMGNADICTLLCERGGTKINALTRKGRSALQIACEKNSSSIVEVLLKHRAEITCEVLENASYRDLKAMLDSAAERALNLPPERHSVRQLETGVAALLNKQDAVGKTLLMRLVEKGEYLKCGLLLEYPVNITLIDIRGRNVLHHACYVELDLEKLRFDKFIKTLSLLLKHKAVTRAFINQYDELGKTPLHYASAGGAGARVAVRMLLEKGADPDLTESNQDRTSTPRNRALTKNISALLKLYSENSTN